MAQGWPALQMSVGMAQNFFSRHIISPFTSVKKAISIVPRVNNVCYCNLFLKRSLATLPGHFHEFAIWFASLRVVFWVVVTFSLDAAGDMLRHIVYLQPSHRYEEEIYVPTWLSLLHCEMFEFVFPLLDHFHVLTHLGCAYYALVILFQKSLQHFIVMNQQNL